MVRPLIATHYTFTEEEVEAAMCLWEYCILCRSHNDDTVFDWMRGGEGAANARQMCIDLAKDCEKSYILANQLGYDTSFDWEFVPAWVRLAMNITETHELTEAWITYMGMEIYREFRLEHK